MKSQATRIDVIERQQQRRRARIAWLICLPIAAGYFAALLTFPIWS